MALTAELEPSDDRRDSPFNKYNTHCAGQQTVEVVIDIIQGGPKVVSHYQMNNKSYKIVLKIANYIKFFRQLEVSKKYYDTGITTWY